MTEILFYHLERARLEDVLPQLVHKTLERGWRAVVQTVSAERVGEISSRLWQWRDDEFLAHGSAADGNGEHQPVWLTDADDNPNAATIRFLVDGARFEDPAGLERLIIMFDGNDETAVGEAREKWKAVTADGFTATYWQQGERGGWEKKAESGKPDQAASQGNTDE